MNKFLSKILLGFAAVCLLTTGFSSWIFSGTLNDPVKGSNGVTTGQTDAVAYIESNPAKKYTTIEKAVEVANSLGGNQNVWTIYSDAKPLVTTIKRDITLNSGVNLLIPCALDASNNPKKLMYAADETVTAGEKVFADETPALVQKYRKAQINVADNVTITVSSGARIVVGGLCGNGQSSSSVVCHTAANYTELVLGQNAKIINKGVFECYGFIKEKTLNNNSIFECMSGTIYMPMVIYDLSGGGHTAMAVNVAKVSPFRIFDFCNIQCLFKLDYGSKLISKVRLTIRGTTKEANVTTVSSANEASVFRLLAGSYITLKYDARDSDNMTDSKQIHRTKIVLYGDTQLDNLKLVINWISDIQIDSRNFLLPMSNRMNIELAPGAVCDCKAGIKFLPGSDFLINPGARFRVSKEVIVYSSYDASKAPINNQAYPRDSEKAEYDSFINKEPYNGGANFVNNGELVLGNYDTKIGTKFGGLVKTTKENATVTTQNNIKLLSSTCEMNGSRDCPSLKLGSKDVPGKGFFPVLSQTEDARLQFQNNGSKIVKTIEPNKVYKSRADGTWYNEENPTALPPDYYKLKMHVVVEDLNFYKEKSTNRSAWRQSIDVETAVYSNGKYTNNVSWYSDLSNAGGALMPKDYNSCFYFRIYNAHYDVIGQGPTVLKIYDENGGGKDHKTYYRFQDLDYNKDNVVNIYTVPNKCHGYLPV